MKEYEMAWKQIEYNMNTNWQFLAMLLSLAGAANLVGGFFRDKPAYDLFIWSSISAFVFLGILYALFFERNTTIAHLHSIRRLEIEAQLGMRANWRECLDRKELEQDIKKWTREGVKGLDFTEAERIIEGDDRSESSVDLLNRIASRKRLDALQKWQLKPWMSARKLVYAGGTVLALWTAVTIYLGLQPIIN